MNDPHAFSLATSLLTNMHLNSFFWGDIAKKVDGLSDVWAYPTESFSFEFSTPLNLSLTPICSFDSPAL